MNDTAIKRALAAKLLRSANLSWDDCEYGAPQIDPKRPYGNSNVPDDIREKLGMEDLTDDDCRAIHLQAFIVLRQKLHGMECSCWVCKDRADALPRGVE